MLISAEDRAFTCPSRGFHQQMRILIQSDTLGFVAACRTDDRHRTADAAKPFAVLLEQLGFLALIEQRVHVLEVVEDSGCQFGSAGRLAEVADGTRDRLYLLGHAGLGCRLMPMPTTSELTVPVSPSMVASVRMPHSLRPFISTSFTHLICGVKLAVCSMARTTAIAAEMVTNDRCDSGSVGCSRMVMYTPVSAGETNVRPSRPRPPVCSSANSVKPCLRRDTAPSSSCWTR